MFKALYIKLDHVCETYICPQLAKVNDVENVGQSFIILRKMYNTRQDVSTYEHL